VNRRQKKVAIAAMATLIAVAAIAIAMRPFVMPLADPDWDTASFADTGRNSGEAEPEMLEQLDFADLVTRRLQGPPPPPPPPEDVAPAANTEEPTVAEPPPLPPPPDFRLVSMYAGPKVVIASFAKSDGTLENGAVGDVVFGAEILDVNIDGRRAKVRYRGEIHWLSMDF
jgi:hypothetical protein